MYVRNVPFGKENRATFEKATEITRQQMKHAAENGVEVRVKIGQQIWQKTGKVRWQATVFKMRLGLSPARWRLAKTPCFRDRAVHYNGNDVLKLTLCAKDTKV